MSLKVKVPSQIPTTLPKTKPKTQPVIADEVSSEHGLWVSEDLYWSDYYDHPDFTYEWNNGLLEEKPMADFGNASIYLWFIELLRRFLEVHPIAKMTALDIGFRLKLSGEVTIRRPDLGIILNDNRVGITRRERTYQGTFDICIESLSDSRRKIRERDTEKKKKEYEQVGVREYYILDDSGEDMAFYYRNEAGEYEQMEGRDKDLIQSEVLPGFQFRKSDLYKQPTQLEMAEDEVYRDFILVEYQTARRQAEQEKVRAERIESELIQERQRVEEEKARAERIESELIQERQRADQEQARAEQMVTKLKALGISPD